VCFGILVSIIVRHIYSISVGNLPGYGNSFKSNQRVNNWRKKTELKK